MGAACHKGMVAGRGKRWSGLAGLPTPQTRGGGRIDDGLLEVERHSAGQRSVRVHPQGNLDLSTFPRMESELRSELRASETVLVDLTGPSGSSTHPGSGLCSRRSDERGGRLSDAYGQDRFRSQVERVFKLARIDTALPLYLEREEAMTALERPAG